MKRTIIVLALAAAMVLAFASAAFAISPAYQDWNPTAGSNATSAQTPHKDYQTTTVKCAVCHSVHAAGWYKTADNTTTGSQTAGIKKAGSASELLLRSSVADACTYCHIDTNIGVTQIYVNADGTGNYYNYNSASPGAVVNDYGHNGGPTGHASCATCHAVHGANTFDGAVSEKILKKGNFEAALLADLADGTYAPGAAPIADVFTSSDRGAQVTTFCTQCHANYSHASEQIITSTGYFNDPANGGIIGGTKFYSSHPMKVASTSFDAQGASTTAKGKQVAFSDSWYCRSCHSAGLVDAGPGPVVSSFPHYTPNHAEFLDKASDSASAKQDVLAGEQDQDGVCLQCHRNGSGAGVGQSF